METTDLSTDVIGKPVVGFHVGRYSTWLELEGGVELHVEPKIHNGDCKDGNAYATLSVRIA